MTENGLKGVLFVLSAPSGAGKTSLAQALLKQVPDLRLSVSHTTRAPRDYERPGVDYHFVNPDEFEALARQGRFLEHAKVFDHRYGTSRDWVEGELAAGRDIILDIDWQGARQVRQALAGAVQIFLLPPSLKALEERLARRGDADENIKRRMQDAVNEISHYREYDYLVINDDFDQTLAQLMAIRAATRHERRLQQAHYDSRVAALLKG